MARCKKVAKPIITKKLSLTPENIEDSGTEDSQSPVSNNDNNNSNSAQKEADKKMLSSILAHVATLEKEIKNWKIM